MGGEPTFGTTLPTAGRAKRAVRLVRVGYETLSQTGAELLFEVFSQRYERGSVGSIRRPQSIELTCEGCAQGVAIGFRQPVRHLMKQ
jgi:hypothetical protein